MCVHVCAQSCSTLCNPIDCSPPGSSIQRIFQARIVEWVAISYSRESSRPRDWICISCFLDWQMDSLPLEPTEKPLCLRLFMITMEKLVTKTIQTYEHFLKRSIVAILINLSENIYSNFRRIYLLFPICLELRHCQLWC